jgi:hypothetical protein
VNNETNTRIANPVRTGHKPLPVAVSDVITALTEISKLPISAVAFFVHRKKPQAKTACHQLAARCNQNVILLAVCVARLAVCPTRANVVGFTVIGIQRRQICRVIAWHINLLFLCN